MSATRLVSIPAYTQFHDEARDWDDFVALYTRWLTGPVLSADPEQRLADMALNWRVFGEAEPARSLLVAPTIPPLGLWNLKRFDVGDVDEAVRSDGDALGAYLATRPVGELAERTLTDTWCKNVITDNGASAMLKNSWATSIPSGGNVNSGPFNRIWITTFQSAPTLATAITSNQAGVVSLTVNAFPASTRGYATNDTVYVGYGNPANQFVASVTVSGTWSSGTSISVSSFTGPSGGVPIGSYVVFNPTVADAPSGLSGTFADSGALAGGAFTYTLTSGAGNRQVQIQYTFPTSTTAGTYTEAYTGNVAAAGSGLATTVGAGAVGSHLTFSGQVINATTSLQVTITEKV